MALSDLLYKGAAAVERRIPGLLTGTQGLIESKAVEAGNQLLEHPEMFKQLVDRTVARTGEAPAQAVPKVFMYMLEKGGLATTERAEPYKWRGLVDPLLPQIVPTAAPTKRVGIVGKFLGRAQEGEMLFGARMNPIVDDLASRMAYSINTRNGIEDWVGTLKNYTQRTGSKLQEISRSPEFLSDLGATFAPIAKTYSRLITKSQNYAELVNEAKTLVNKTNPNVRLAREKLADANKLRPVVLGLEAQVNAAFDPFMIRWAQKSPEARIAWGALPEKHPQIAAMLTPEEAKVAGAMREYMKLVKAKADARGIATMDRPYLPHLTDALGIAIKRLPTEAAKTADKALPDIVEWSHRSPASKMWIPDPVALMASYIPSANLKLTKSAMLAKWSPYFNDKVKPVNASVYQWWERYQDQSKKMDTALSGADKAFETVTWWKHLVATGLSSSTGFKHLTKSAYLLGLHPSETLAMLPQRVRASAENLARQAGASTSATADLIHNMVAYRGMYNAMYGLHDMGKWQGLFNTLSMNPTLAAEYGERGLAVLASALKGYNKNLSFKDTYRGMLQTILDCNFMGAVDRPQWLDKPWQRLLGMFSYTPLQMTSRTYKWLAKSIPEVDMEALRRGMWGHVLQQPTDAFGTPYVNTVAKSAIAIGLMEAAARSQGVSILRMLFHFPMTRETPGKPIDFNVPVYDMYKDFTEMGGDKEALKTAFLRHYAEFQGVKRYIRAAKGSIPRMYAPEKPGATMRYLLGTPDIEAKERLEQLYEKRHRGDKHRQRVERELFTGPTKD